jgi:hypothetical protein
MVISDFNLPRNMSKSEAVVNIARLLTGALTIVLPLAASDIVTDFSTIFNPNGQYQYGAESLLGGAFTLDTTTVSGPGYAGWSGNVSGFPLTLANTSGSTFTSGTVTYSTDYINLHPASDDTFAVLRYTITVPGAYLISGAFRGQDINGTSSDVHVLVNGASAFDSEVTGYLDPSKQTFSLLGAFNANDTIDFAVGFGTNGTYFYDSTGLQGTIAAVASPEPDSAILIFSGLALCGLFRKRASMTWARARS